MLIAVSKAALYRRSAGTERDSVRNDGAATAEGPRVGLASYQLADPESTFRLIERFRPRRPPRRIGLVGWSLRILLIWSVNLAALAAAGMLVTNVGTNDPSTYVAGAVVFGVVGVAPALGVRFGRGRGWIAAPVLGLLAIDALMVWVMTLVAPPFHAPDLRAIVKAGVVLWLANVPLWVLLPLRPAPAPSPPSA